MTQSITVETMRSKLLSLDAVRGTLAATEPLSTYEFTIGNEVRFEVDQGWQHGIDAKNPTDQVDARIILGYPGAGSRVFPLSKDAMLEATSVCGLTKSYAARCPGELLEPQLNYWFRTGLGERRGVRDFQLLVAGGTGAAVTRASINPFSNLRLLDEALDGITRRFGANEILVDYKFVHSLRRTHLRLIIPERVRQMTGTGTADDAWSTGISIKNSLTGDERTSIEGYLFRWWCTNGALDTRNSTGAWTRRGNSNPEDVYEWARATVDEVLGGLEPALDGVQQLVDIPVEGEANDVLRDVFTHYRVPVPERARIIESLVDSHGPLTMYSVMNAITEVANRTDMDPAHIDNLMRMGGELVHDAPARCGACRRLQAH